ncbi:MAG: hypothetical protein HS115_04505 [Spirochaetales bacterium]|nr:hypothetical protein [Spirochaetales bacterium]
MTAALFISSSDNTRDVFEQIFPALRKFWPDCPFPIYAGFNTMPEQTEGFVPVLAKKSSWREEIREQLLQLKASHIILLLDDFLLRSPVHTAELVDLVQLCQSGDVAYLRLIPRSRAFLPWLWLRWQSYRGRAKGLEEIPRHWPYYSALQIAIWRRSHLLEMLQADGNIWDFEHQAIPGQTHYALTGRPPIDYGHVVEKGVYQSDIKELMNSLGFTFHAGNRPVASRASSWKLRWNACKFQLIGYSFLRLRRLLRS